MVREDLIASAVSFLQDPSVAASSVDKRIAFLQSKNLTQDEIDESLARAGDGSHMSNVSPPPVQSQQSYGYPNQQAMRQPVGYGYRPYQGGPWGQAPPEPPVRDWRDWFIMATVTSGVGYGLYVVAKRYVLPLISPPTPPQLESDKASIDESFTRAFTLIDQLAADTATLKSSEAERTEKLDSTLRDVDAVIADLKTANTRRENESRNIADQVQNLKELVPKALEGWKSSGDKRLEELGAEMRSLKKLLSNRVGGGGAAAPSGRPYSGAASEKDRSIPAYSAGTSTAPSGIASSATAEDTDGTTTSTIPSAPAPGVAVPRSSSGYQNTGRAAIPEWQMAAAGVSSKFQVPSVGASASGKGVTEAGD